MSAGNDIFSNELAEVFALELQEFLENVPAEFERLSNSDSFPEAGYKLYRTFHTIKGSARMVGMSDLGDVALRLELRFKEKEKLEDIPFAGCQEDLEQLYFAAGQVAPLFPFASGHTPRVSDATPVPPTVAIPVPPQPPPTATIPPTQEQVSVVPVTEQHAAAPIGHAISIDLNALRLPLADADAEAACRHLASPNTEIAKPVWNDAVETLLSRLRSGSSGRWLASLAGMYERIAAKLIVHHDATLRLLVEHSAALLADVAFGRHVAEPPLLAECLEQLNAEIVHYHDNRTRDENVRKRIVSLLARASSGMPEDSASLVHKTFAEKADTAALIRNPSLHGGRSLLLDHRGFDALPAAEQLALGEQLASIGCSLSTSPGLEQCAVAIRLLNRGAWVAVTTPRRKAILRVARKSDAMRIANQARKFAAHDSSRDSLFDEIDGHMQSVLDAIYGLSKCAKRDDARKLHDAARTLGSLASALQCLYLPLACNLAEAMGAVTYAFIESDSADLATLVESLNDSAIPFEMLVQESFNGEHKRRTSNLYREFWQCFPREFRDLLTKTNDDANPAENGSVEPSAAGVSSTPHSQE